MRGGTLFGVVAILAACGDGRIVPDATGEPEDLRGLVTLEYLTNEQQVYNEVFFQNADSTLVLSTRTDIDGKANAFMAPGGFVTLVGENTHLYTFSNVQPGDALVLDTRDGQNLGEYELYVTFPAYPDAVTYELHSNCGFQSLGPDPGTIRVTLFGCRSNRTNLIVIARDTAGRQAFQYLPEIVLIGMGISAQYAQFTGPWLPSQSSTVNVSNATGPQTWVTQQLVGLAMQPGSAFINLVGGAGSASVAVPIVAGSTVATTLEFFVGDKKELPSAFNVQQWESARPVTTIDLGDTTLREYTRYPTFDPTAHTVTWSEDPNGAVADGVILNLSFQQPEVFSIVQWSAIQRRTEETVVRLPMLPRERYNPPDEPGTTNIGNLVNFSIDGGYDRVRTSLLGRWSFENGIGSNAFPPPPDGPSGRATYRALF